MRDEWAVVGLLLAIAAGMWLTTFGLIFLDQRSADSRQDVCVCAERP